MLTQAELEQRSGSQPTRRPRPPLSPKQRYQQYLLQRIEDYKNSLPRAELLRLAEEAIAEEHDDPTGQYVLTDVLVQDIVDKYFMKRLHLPGFNRWRQKFAKLRQAQREPTHWGLERRGALAALLQRIEPDDHAVMIGSGAEAMVYLLAAHDVRLTCLFEDNPACSRIETRMAAESLTGDFVAYVAMLGTWFPEVEAPVHLVVVDSGILAEVSAQRRFSLMAWLQDLTMPGGLHAVMARAGEGSAAAETWLSLYPDWERIPLKPEPGRRGTKRGG
ncbi:MAG: hypothetical protein ACT4PM_00530, partial [Gemmatimonadales bacterium]